VRGARQSLQVSHFLILWHAFYCFVERSSCTRTDCGNGRGRTRSGLIVEGGELPAHVWIHLSRFGFCEDLCCLLASWKNCEPASLTALSPCHVHLLANENVGVRGEITCSWNNAKHIGENPNVLSLLRMCMCMCNLVFSMSHFTFFRQSLTYCYRDTLHRILTAFVSCSKSKNHHKIEHVQFVR
jgi:hypothetical protein